MSTSHIFRLFVISRITRDSRCHLLPESLFAKQPRRSHSMLDSCIQSRSPPQNRSDWLHLLELDTACLRSIWLVFLLHETPISTWRSQGFSQYVCGAHTTGHHTGYRSLQISRCQNNITIYATGLHPSFPSQLPSPVDPHPLSSPCGLPSVNITFSYQHQSTT